MCLLIGELRRHARRHAASLLTGDIQLHDRVFRFTCGSWRVSKRVPEAPSGSGSRWRGRSASHAFEALRIEDRVGCHSSSPMWRAVAGELVTCDCRARLPSLLVSDPAAINHSDCGTLNHRPLRYGGSLGGISSDVPATVGPSQTLRPGSQWPARA